MKHSLHLSIVPPTEFQDKFAHLAASITKLGIPITWQKPALVTLVLNDLGRITDNQLSEVIKSIKTVSKYVYPFDLTLDYLQTLYSRHEPSQIYLSVAKSSKLISFHRELSFRFADLAIPQPIRFQPRFILGQLNRFDPPTTKMYLDKLSDYNSFAPVTFSVDKLILFELFLTKNSTHYQRIGSFSMFGSADDSRQ